MVEINIYGTSQRSQIDNNNNNNNTYDKSQKETRQIKDIFVFFYVATNIFFSLPSLHNI